MTFTKQHLFTIIVLLLIVAAVGFVALRSSQQAATHQSDAAQALISGGESAPYTDMDGNPVQLDDYVGSGILVVNTWASWCPFCVKELPDLEQLAETNVAQGVTVLAINRMESKERAQRFLDRTGDYDSIVFLLDPEDHFYTSVSGFAMPETVFYDETGSMVFHKRGVMDYDEMQRELDKILTAEVE